MNTNNPTKYKKWKSNKQKKNKKNQKKGKGLPKKYRKKKKNQSKLQGIDIKKLKKINKESIFRIKKSEICDPIILSYIHYILITSDKNFDGKCFASWRSPQGSNASSSGISSSSSPES